MFVQRLNIPDSRLPQTHTVTFRMDPEICDFTEVIPGHNLRLTGVLQAIAKNMYYIKMEFIYCADNGNVALWS